MSARPASALLGLAVLGAVACAGELPPIAHPRAASVSLGVNEDAARARFGRRRYDPLAQSERLHGAVARITVVHADGVSRGSGVAFCQVGRIVYVLTARHVATGEGRPDATGHERRFAFVERIELDFFRNTLPSVVGSEQDFAMRGVEGLDAALMQIELPREADRVPSLAVGRSAALRHGDPVRTLGYSWDALDDWAPQDGRVQDVGSFLGYAPAVSQGYSGGPVFDGQDRLVALNTHVEAGRTTWALPLERVLPAVREWVDPACPRLGP